MNRKQLIILLVLVVIIGGAGLYRLKQQSASWQGANPAIGKKLLGDFPVNNVTHIALKQGTNELNLAKTNDVWCVHERNDYPANYSEISEFLLKVADLKIVQTDKVGPSQLSRYWLVPGQSTNSALAVDFKDQNDKSIRSLLLGKKHMKKAERPSPYGDMGEEGWPDGRYVKVGADSDSVAIISDALANIDPKPEQWLNKDFFKIEKPRAIAVAYPNATNSWKLTRETETGEWKLADAKPTEQLDSSKASSAGNALAAPNFNDVAIGAKPEELGLDKPTVVSIDTFDNFTYTLKLGQKTNDNLPVALAVTAALPKERAPGKDEKPEDKEKLDKEFKEKQKKLEEKLAQEKNYEKWTYLASSWTFDSLLKDRSQILVEKKEEPKKEDARKDEPKTEEAKKDDKPPGESPKPDEPKKPEAPPPPAPTTP